MEKQRNQNLTSKNNKNKPIFFQYHKRIENCLKKNLANVLLIVFLYWMLKQI